MTKHQFVEGISPSTGEYFFRETKRTKPRPQKFWLDSDTSIITQLWGRLPYEKLVEIDDLRTAFLLLERAGILPEGRGRAAWRQIVRKVEIAVNRHAKAKGGQP